MVLGGGFGPDVLLVESRNLQRPLSWQDLDRPSSRSALGQYDRQHCLRVSKCCFRAVKSIPAYPDYVVVKVLVTVAVRVVVLDWVAVVVVENLRQVHVSLGTPHFMHNLMVLPPRRPTWVLKKLTRQLIAKAMEAFELGLQFMLGRPVSEQPWIPASHRQEYVIIN